MLWPIPVVRGEMLISRKSPEKQMTAELAMKQEYT
jgi:hypothetical protein